MKIVREILFVLLLLFTLAPLPILLITVFIQWIYSKYDMHGRAAEVTTAQVTDRRSYFLSEWIGAHELITPEMGYEVTFSIEGQSFITLVSQELYQAAKEITVLCKKGKSKKIYVQKVLDSYSKE